MISPSFSAASVSASIIACAYSQARSGEASFPSTPASGRNRRKASRAISGGQSCGMRALSTARGSLTCERGADLDTLCPQPRKATTRRNEFRLIPELDWSLGAAWALALKAVVGAIPGVLVKQIDWL